MPGHSPSQTLKQTSTDPTAALTGQGTAELATLTPPIGHWVIWWALGLPIEPRAGASAAAPTVRMNNPPQLFLCAPKTQFTVGAGMTFGGAKVHIHVLSERWSRKVHAAYCQHSKSGDFPTMCLDLGKKKTNPVSTLTCYRYRLKVK